MRDLQEPTDKPFEPHTEPSVRDTAVLTKLPQPFVAVFKLPANPYDKTHDKYTCEQIVKNATPGSESHEAAKKALQHWPSA